MLGANPAGSAYLGQTWPGASQIALSGSSAGIGGNALAQLGYILTVAGSPAGVGAITNANLTVAAPASFPVTLKALAAGTPDSRFPSSAGVPGSGGFSPPAGTWITDTPTLETLLSQGVARTILIEDSGVPYTASSGVFVWGAAHQVWTRTPGGATLVGAHSLGDAVTNGASIRGPRLKYGDPVLAVNGALFNAWGVNARGVKINDIFLDGMGTLTYGIRILQTSGTVIRRVQFGGGAQAQCFTDYGILVNAQGITDAPATPPIIEDIYGRGVYRNTRGSSNGLAESLIDIGCTFQGARWDLGDAGFTCVWLGGNCINWSLTDALLGDVYGATSGQRQSYGIVMEHFVEDGTISHSYFGPRLDIGIFARWIGNPGDWTLHLPADTTTAAAHRITVQDNIFDAGDYGLFLDVGTEGTIVRRNRFGRASIAAVNAPSNVGLIIGSGPDANDYTAITGSQLTTNATIPTYSASTRPPDTDFFVDRPGNYGALGSTAVATGVLSVVHTAADIAVSGSSAGVASSPALTIEPVPTGKTYYIQLPGALAMARASAVDWTIFDYALATSAADLSALHLSGKKALAYINAGQWEASRSDAGSFPAGVQGNLVPGSATDKWLDIRASSGALAIIQPLMAARVTAALAMGFDGIMWDNLDNYARSTSFPITFQDQVDYVAWLSSVVKAAHVPVGGEISTGQYGLLTPTDYLYRLFDYLVAEEVMKTSMTAATGNFFRRGKAIFGLEYGVAVPADQATAQTVGISLIYRNTSLTATGTYTTTPPPPPVAPLPSGNLDVVLGLAGTPAGLGGISSPNVTWLISSSIIAHASISLSALGANRGIAGPSPGLGSITLALLGQDFAIAAESDGLGGDSGVLDVTANPILPVPHVVSTTAIGQDRASLNANAGHTGVDVDFYVGVEWGLTTSYGSSSTPSLVSHLTPFDPLPYTYPITGLNFNTTYHWRAWAYRADLYGGVQVSADASFLTKDSLVASVLGVASLSANLGTIVHLSGESDGQSDVISLFDAGTGLATDITASSELDADLWVNYVLTGVSQGLTSLSGTLPNVELAGESNGQAMVAGALPAVNEVLLVGTSFGSTPVLGWLTLPDFPTSITAKPSNIGDGLVVLASHVGNLWDVVRQIESEVLGAGSGNFTLDIRPTAVGNTVLSTRQSTGMSSPSWSMNGLGQMSWGSGTAVQDTVLNRSAARTLRLAGNFSIQSQNANEIPLLIQPAVPSQSVDYIRVNNSAGTAVLNLTSVGLLKVPGGQVQLADTFLTATGSLHLQLSAHTDITGNLTIAGSGAIGSVPAPGDNSTRIPSTAWVMAQNVISKREIQGTGDLPTSGTEGDIVVKAIAESLQFGGNMVWRFLFDSGLFTADGYGWKFIGGAALATQDVTGPTFTINGSPQFPSGTPALVLPYAGYYEIDFGAVIASVGFGQSVFAVLRIGGSTIYPSASIYEPQAQSGGSYTLVTNKFFYFTSTAGQSVEVGVGGTGSGTSSPARRWLSINPMRVK